MTNNIHGIGINTGSVNPYGNQAKGSEAKPEEKKTDNQQAAPQNAQVKADDVLNYMAMQAVVAKPQVASAKTYDIQKYVSPEQAQRIAGFVTSFEDKVAEGLLALNSMDELAGLSEQAKYEIAANMV